MYVFVCVFVCAGVVRFPACSACTSMPLFVCERGGHSTIDLIMTQVRVCVCVCACMSCIFVRAVCVRACGYACLCVWMNSILNATIVRVCDEVDSAFDSATACHVYMFVCLCVRTFVVNFQVCSVFLCVSLCMCGGWGGFDV